jgi:hypothetical protein
MTDLAVLSTVLRDPKDPAHVGEGQRKLPLLMLTDLAGVLRAREDLAHAS